jgi:uncharacterized protein DUF559
VLDHDQLRRAIRQSQFLGLTTLGSLVAALRGPGPSRGRRTFAQVIATGAAPTRSELEDAVWPDERIVIEADGPHHDDAFERMADRERQAILEAHGYRVIRVTWEQAIAQPGRTLRRFREGHAPRAVD